MNRLSLLFLFTVLYTISFGASIGENNSISDTNTILLSVGRAKKKISLTALSAISVKDFEAFANRKMNFFDRIAFKLIQKKLKKSIHENGTIKNEKLRKFLTGSEGDQTRFHTGGFLLGFLVGIPGVLISYIIEDDNKRRRVKWSWVGLGIRAVIASILFLILFS